MSLLRVLPATRLGCRHCSFSSILTFGSKQQTSRSPDVDNKQDHQKNCHTEIAIEPKRDQHRVPYSAPSSSKQEVNTRQYPDTSLTIQKRRQRKVELGPLGGDLRTTADKGHTIENNEKRPGAFSRSLFHKKKWQRVEDSAAFRGDDIHQDRANSSRWNDGRCMDRELRPPGKRLRKKLKQGELALGEQTPDTGTEQLLYGLHPVQLALAAGRRSVMTVYHRRDGGKRLRALLERCSAQGIATVPLPTVQLDRMAQGTGVHQGVLARVSPLPAIPVDELMVQCGYRTLQSEVESGLTRDDASSDAECVGRTTTMESSDGVKTPVSKVIKSDECGENSSGSLISGVSKTQRDEAIGSTETSVLAGSSIFQDTESRCDHQVASTPCNTPWVCGDATYSDQTTTPGSGVTSEGLHTVRRRRVWLLLDCVQDPMNMGSILRSSYFLGVDAVIVPDRNSCPLSPTVSKASAGALEVLPVHVVPATSCRQLLQLLARHGWQLLAADTDTATAAPPAEICSTADTLLTVGNEGVGVAPELAELCQPVTIPPQRQLVDGVESLNVGVAAGILISRLTSSYASRRT